MKIIVFGAAGDVGRRVVDEAVARGHEVTAVVRRPALFPPQVAMVQGDAADPATVARLAAEHDAIVGATRPRPGGEHELVTVAKALLAGAAAAHARLLLVGGSATLTLPGRTHTVLDDPDYPPAWRAIGEACAEQYAVTIADRDADWTYLSPPALLEPGERTGTYRTGRDELLTDPSGTSRISMEDFATALLDELEHPRHPRTRFTVAT